MSVCLSTPCVQRVLPAASRLGGGGLGAAPLLLSVRSLSLHSCLIVATFSRCKRDTRCIVKDARTARIKHFRDLISSPISLGLRQAPPSIARGGRVLTQGALVFCSPCRADNKLGKF